MDDRRLTFLIVHEKLVDHKIQSFLTGRQGSVSIGPGGDLVVSDYSLEVIVVIFDVYFSDS